MIDTDLDGKTLNFWRVVRSILKKKDFESDDDHIIITHYVNKSNKNQIKIAIYWRIEYYLLIISLIGS